MNKNCCSKMVLRIFFLVTSALKLLSALHGNTNWSLINYYGNIQKMNNVTAILITGTICNSYTMATRDLPDI